MGQPSSGQKHPTPISVAELEKQGKPKSYPGSGNMKVKSLMKQ